MEELGSTDRCDSCNAQAYVRYNKGDLTLDFCGHHAARNDAALEQNDWSILIDIRNLLTRRSVGAEVS